MKKIFFFDIDNTLLDHQTNQIPASALNAIDSLRDDGLTIAIATGRGFGHAEEYIDLVKPDYTITQNGARIMRRKEVIDRTPLEHAPLMDLFAWMSELSLPYGINDGLVGHVSAHTDGVMTALDSVAIAVNDDAAFYQNSEVFQAWLFIDEDIEQTILPELFARFPDFDYVRWHTHAMDVMPRGVNKLSACRFVLEQSGMTLEDAYAFGDGLNDLEMLAGMGTGIAVGNAHPKLKAVADRIAEHISDDGIAKMIAQLRSELSASV